MISNNRIDSSGLFGLISNEKMIIVLMSKKQANHFLSSHKAFRLIIDCGDIFGSMHI